MDSSFRSVRYVIPSGPGADFFLHFERVLRISLGLMGAVLNCVKSPSSGNVGRFGNQFSFEKLKKSSDRSSYIMDIFHDGRSALGSQRMFMLIEHYEIFGISDCFLEYQLAFELHQL